MLVLSRHAGEGINIGQAIKVTVLSVAGDKVRIGIEAPPDVQVHREEVFDEIEQDDVEEGDGVASGTVALTDQLRGIVADTSLGGVGIRRSATPAQ